MSPGSIVRERAAELAVEVTRYVAELVSKTRQYAICDQLIRSGTSPGANLAEARAAESKKDLVHKLKIALKESRETEFWLDVIKKSGNSIPEYHEKVNGLNNEVISLLVVALGSLKRMN